MNSFLEFSMHTKHIFVGAFVRARAHTPHRIKSIEIYFIGSGVCARSGTETRDVNFPNFHFCMRNYSGSERMRTEGQISNQNDFITFEYFSTFSRFFIIFYIANYQ